VNEILHIADILPAYQKKDFSILINAEDGLIEDNLHIGYLKLDKI